MIPLIVAGVAAAVAAGASAYSEYNKSKAASNAKSQANQNAANAQQWADNLVKTVQLHNASTSGYGTAQDAANYADAVRGTNYIDLYNQFWDKNGDGIVDDSDISEFSYNKSVEDFMNPNKERLLGALTKQLQGTAAGSGMAHSTYGLQNIANGVADKNEMLYANALSQYNSDRQFAYQNWNDYLTQKREQYNNLVGATTSNMEQLKGLADSFLEEQQDEFSDLMNAYIAGQNMVQGAQNTAAQTGNYTFDLGSVIGNGANAFGTLYGATASTGNKNAF